MSSDRCGGFANMNEEDKSWTRVMQADVYKRQLPDDSRQEKQIDTIKTKTRTEPAI